MLAFSFITGTNPTGKAWITSLRVNIKTFTGKSIPARINLPTGPDHSQGQHIRPLFDRQYIINVLCAPHEKQGIIQSILLRSDS